MRVGQTFKIRRSPQDIFAYMTDPANLAEWQTAKTEVRPVTEGPPRLGYRVFERTKVGPREWDQVVEFTEFEPGRVFGVKVVEGPPSTGRWTLTADGDVTRVECAVELEAPRLLAPVMKIAIDRQFRKYHDNLKRLLERPDRGGW